MRLTKHTSYAIKILVEAARAGDAPLRVADIAPRNGFTVQHGLKIANALMRAGFVINRRGRIGGIRLARPATEITVGAVVRALESTNLDNSDAIPGAPVFDAAFGAFLTVLDQHSIADFAKAALPPADLQRPGRTPARARRQRSQPPAARH
jgi:Rrf2 family protein